MLTCITQNLATIIISAVLIFAVALVIRSMVRNKKMGKSSCGCGCGSCAMKDCCHK